MTDLFPVKVECNRVLDALSTLAVEIDQSALNADKIVSMYELATDTNGDKMAEAASNIISTIDAIDKLFQGKDIITATHAVSTLQSGVQLVN